MLVADGSIADHLRAQPRERLAQQAGAAADIEDAQTRQAVQAFGVALELAAGGVADIAEPQRIDLVQRGHLAPGVPPLVRQLREFCDFGRIDRGPQGQDGPVTQDQSAAARLYPRRGLPKFDRNARSLSCLSGLRILDIGCGAGLLCEPFTRLGAQVIGIDPSATNIAAARLHADKGHLSIDYRCTTVEEDGRARALRHRAGDGSDRACYRCQRCSSPAVRQWSSQAGSWWSRP